MKLCENWPWKSFRCLDIRSMEAGLRMPDVQTIIKDHSELFFCGILFAFFIYLYLSLV